ncbi:XdhC/CoxI family protein [Nocardia sp. NPDC004168]|uniref:XdhC/CoxI family protein n=1 Tax=Nocardia sp. NPDC004168 TaxID=3154452 RepID=UPI0033A07CE5
MLDQFEFVSALRRAGRPFATAQLVNAIGSAPRQVGASMIVSSDGTVWGSVSGGCVEGAVYDIAMDSLKSGKPSLHRFGVSDEAALNVGLTCGGIIDIFIQSFTDASFTAWWPLHNAVDCGRPVALATVIEHPRGELVGRQVVIESSTEFGTFGDEDDRIFAKICEQARMMLSSGHRSALTYRGRSRDFGANIEVFVETSLVAPRMIIVGAVDFTAALVTLGSFLGYKVTVCDARPVFTTRSRFPGADQVVVSWPGKYIDGEFEADRLDRRTVVCVLTHDSKFDIPVLARLLRLPDESRPRYIGAMGSRRTHAKRIEELRRVGLTDSQLSFLRSPIGLDLGAHTPEETAVSIVSEMIADNSGGTGLRLSDGSGAIHHNHWTTARPPVVDAAWTGERCGPLPP